MRKEGGFQREAHLNAEMEEERKIIYEQVGIEVLCPHRARARTHDPVSASSGHKILNSGNVCDVRRRRISSYPHGADFVRIHKSPTLLRYIRLMWCAAIELKKVLNKGSTKVQKGTDAQEQMGWS